MVISSSWYDNISIFLGRKNKIIERGLHKPSVLIIHQKFVLERVMSYMCIASMIA
jgi:hypothetical protein